MDYIKFFNENCQLCGSQRCPGDHEAIDTCGKNTNSDYAKNTKRMAEQPNWKKQVYNDNFAAGAIGGGTAGRIVVGSTSDGSDSNCKDCARKEICKYVSYYAELVEIANQISIDSNFGLRLWCKNYKTDVGIRS
jgi:hypothetical protein